MTLETEQPNTIHSHRHHNNRLTAFVLVIIGTVFLLNNFGLLPWSVWRELWKLWPLLLIIAGLQIFLRGSKISGFIIQVILISIITVATLIIVARTSPAIMNLVNQF